MNPAMYTGIQASYPTAGNTRDFEHDCSKLSITTDLFNLELDMSDWQTFNYNFRLIFPNGSIKKVHYPIVAKMRIHDDRFFGEPATNLTNTREMLVIKAVKEILEPLLISAYGVTDFEQCKSYPYLNFFWWSLLRIKRLEDYYGITPHYDSTLARVLTRKVFLHGTFNDNIAIGEMFHEPIAGEMVFITDMVGDMDGSTSKWVDIARNPGSIYVRASSDEFYQEAKEAAALWGMKLRKASNNIR